jgi:hypothetical protein
MTLYFLLQDSNEEHPGRRLSDNSKDYL